MDRIKNLFNKAKRRISDSFSGSKHDQSSGRRSDPFPFVPISGEAFYSNPAPPHQPVPVFVPNPPAPPIRFPDRFDWDYAGIGPFDPYQYLHPDSYQTQNPQVLPDPYVAPHPYEREIWWTWRVAMASRHLNPPMTVPTRPKQVHEAKKMEKAVLERAERTNVRPPPYEFLELIGKGTFGRVFKGKKLDTNDLVAVKILDVDSSDYRLDPSQREEAIKDFINEARILQQLKDARAKNINTIYDAFCLHSQLWLVSEYCGGGSVHTLMKATPSRGLEEKFIIAIAREVAIALKYVHEQGIIHRDVKCANIFITEDGRVQLGDFGVSGILESQAAKRSTIIGTPNWMAPEMFSSDAPISYGTEVDCWAYGSTVYEMATGTPPKFPISVAADKANLSAARSDGTHLSTALQEFAYFLFEEDPRRRPSAELILLHPYLAETTRRYPTSSLTLLINRFVWWEEQGGQRQSLFNPMIGASGPENLPDLEDNEWNFSTTEAFSGHHASDDYPNNPYEDLNNSLGAGNQGGQMPAGGKSSRELTPYQKAMREAEIRRGERAMERLFNPDAAPYEYNAASRPLSDLPLRNISSDLAGDRTTMIDLDAADIDVIDVPNLDLTIKANKANRFFRDDDDEDDEESPYTQRDSMRRATREWKFPTQLAPPEENRNRRTMEWSFADAQRSLVKEEEVESHAGASQQLGTPFRSQRQLSSSHDFGTNINFHVHSAPASPPGSPRMSMIDLDDADISFMPTRPSTADSTANSSVAGGHVADPFELEHQVPSLDSDSASSTRRTSMHRTTRSAPNHRVSSNLTPPDEHLGRKRGHYRDESLSSNSSAEYPSGGHRRAESNLSSAKQQWAKRLEGLHNKDPVLVGRIERGMFEGGVWDEYDVYDDVIADPSGALADVGGVGGLLGPLHLHRQDAPPAFPPMLPPASDALLHDAPPLVVAEELGRLFGSLHQGLQFTQAAMVSSSARDGVNGVGGGAAD